MTPQGTDLSTGTATTIKVTTDLAFAATVQDSGGFAEANVVVKLTISAGGSTITKQKTISLIEPAKTQAVTFTGFDIPSTAYGATSRRSRSSSHRCAGEINTGNNSATYTVFFTLP